MKSGPSNMDTTHVAFIKPGPIGYFQKSNYHGIRSFKNSTNISIYETLFIRRQP